MKKYNLQLFADGGDGGNSGDTGTVSSNNNAGNGARFSFEQAEEIANARAERAEKAALSSYFKQQGMSESEVTAALAAYKAQKQANTPDVEKLTEENATLKKHIEDNTNKGILTASGVKPEYLDFVLFEVNNKIGDSKKKFSDVAAEYLKDHPVYAGQTTRVTTGSTTGRANNANDGSNSFINDAIRRLAHK